MLRRFIVVAVSLVVLGSSGSAVMSAERNFVSYDNMSYRGKPDTSVDGFIVSNIVYANVIWPHGKNYGVLPAREDFVAIVRSHASNPGPLVLDIENLPLSGSPDIANQHLHTLATLADWARAAAPGKVIGFYGTHTLSKVAPAYLTYAQELAQHVDAFFPPMYTFDDDRGAWEKRAQATAAEARALGPEKPVYFYLWPQYHDGTPRQFQYVDAGYWKVQLETAHRFSDGIVLWGPSRFDWNDETGWWSATQRFVHALSNAR